MRCCESVAVFSQSGFGRSVRDNLREKYRKVKTKPTAKTNKGKSSTVGGAFRAITTRSQPTSGSPRGLFSERKNPASGGPTKTPRTATAITAPMPTHALRRKILIITGTVIVRPQTSCQVKEFGRERERWNGLLYGVAAGGLVARRFRSRVRALSASSKLRSWVFWRLAGSIDSVSAQRV